MTTETLNTSSGPYTGTGATDQAFPVTFQSAGEDEILVYLDGVAVSALLWSFARDVDGQGTVTATLDGEVHIFSSPSFAQEEDFQRLGPYFPDMLNSPLDKAARRDQYLNARLNVLYPANGLFAADRAGQFLVFDAEGVGSLSEGVGGADSALRTDLAASSGAALVGAAYNLAGAPTASLLTIFRAGPCVVLHLCRAAGATDDTAAFQLALTTGLPIYAQAGQGSGTGSDAGRYLITTAISATYVGYLTAGTHIFGDARGDTIIRPVAAGGIVFRILSASAATTIADVRINDLTLYGRVEASGFSEHVHLIHANGVENPIVERVEFKGFQGDGLYIGSGETAGVERHNFNVTVRDCVFDGVNNENRQAISVIDCDGFLIENNEFMDCTKSTMPGAIDAEPDANTFHVVKGGRIENNTFRRIGGNVAVVTILVPSAVTLPPVDIQVTGNRFLDCTNSNAIAINSARTTTATSVDSAIRIERNYGKTGVGPLSIVGIRGVKVARNSFEAYTTYGVCGFDGATDLVRDIEFNDNRWTLIGTDATLPGLLVGKVNGFTMKGDRFDRCGAASTTGNAIRLLTGVTSERIWLEDIEIIAAASQVTAIEATGHTQTAAGNRLIDVRLGGLASEFTAAGPGQVLPPVTATYDPGSLATAASTAIQTMTVTGAALGDTVALSFSNSLAGAVLSAWVSATDTVSYFFTNTNGANPLDLASGTVTAIVTKKLA